MNRIYLFCYYTVAYEVLVREWFLPGARREYRVYLKRWAGKVRALRYKEHGWAATVRRKIKYFAGAISRNKGRVLVFSDPDVQFLGRTRKELLAAIRGKDMVFQKNDPDGTACTGFFACRANAKTLRFWRAVSCAIRRGRGDQDCANIFLLEGLVHREGTGLAEPPLSRNLALALSQAGKNPYHVTWGYLPAGFFGGGTFEGTCWVPGKKLALPAKPLMHHANWCIGLEHKLAQLRYVRKLTGSVK